MKVDGEAANSSGLAREFDLGVALGELKLGLLALSQVDADADYSTRASFVAI